MTKSSILERGIIELRKLVAALWRELSSSDLTPDERSDLRARLMQANRDLRRCMQAYEAETPRFREGGSDALARQPVKLRFIDTDYANTLQPV